MTNSFDNLSKHKIWLQNLIIPATHSLQTLRNKLHFYTKSKQNELAVP